MQHTRDAVHWLLVYGEEGCKLGMEGIQELWDLSLIKALSGNVK
jgi:hypothetical protein